MVAPFLFAVSSCGEASNGGPPSATPADSFEVSIPTSAVLSLDEIDELKRELGEEDGNPPASTLSAAAFEDYSATPIATNAEWQNFLNVYGSVREEAVDNNWIVQVEGFVQSSQPVGSPEPLSGRRAEACRDALIELGYPPETVVAIGRGVGGPSPTDRRVVISFVRNQ